MYYYEFIYATDIIESELKIIRNCHGSWIIQSDKSYEEIYNIAEEYSKRLDREMKEFIKQNYEEIPERYKNMNWIIYCNPVEVFTLEEFNYECFKNELERL